MSRPYLRLQHVRVTFYLFIFSLVLQKSHLIVRHSMEAFILAQIYTKTRWRNCERHKPTFLQIARGHIPLPIFFTALQTFHISIGPLMEAFVHPRVVP